MGRIHTASYEFLVICRMCSSYQDPNSWTWCLRAVCSLTPVTLSSVILKLVGLPRTGTHFSFPGFERYHESFPVPEMPYLISAYMNPPIHSRYITNISSQTFQTKETYGVYLHSGKGNKWENNIFSWSSFFRKNDYNWKNNNSLRWICSRKACLMPLCHLSPGTY